MCAHSDHAPMPRLWKQGSHLPHVDPIHVLNPAAPVLAGPDVWEAWGGTDYQAVSTQHQGPTTQGAPSHHIPYRWDPPQVPRGNPTGSSRAA